MENEKQPESVTEAEKFCKHIDCEVNERGQFIYTSTNGASHINLPYILMEYLEWRISHLKA